MERGGNNKGVINYIIRHFERRIMYVMLYVLSNVQRFDMK